MNVSHDSGRLQSFIMWRRAENITREKPRLIAVHHQNKSSLVNSLTPFK